MACKETRLSRETFVRRSLELHLFFLRIMKEHALFLEAGFVPKDRSLAQQADNFKDEFNRLLFEAVKLACGVVSKKVIESGEVVTRNTLKAELVTQELSGIPIDTSLTQLERALHGDRGPVSPELEARVTSLNRRVILLTSELIRFKTMILDRILCCNLFTYNFPLLINHIRREAKLYVGLLTQLQHRRQPDLKKEILEQEAFWNRIMAEHALFIRNLLDPSEEKLFEASQSFADEFFALTEEAEETKCRDEMIRGLTNESLSATKAIRNFKAEATILLLRCKIKSIIVPLLADHVTREANHYLRLLKDFRQELIREHDHN